METSPGLAVGSMRLWFSIFVGGCDFESLRLPPIVRATRVDRAGARQGSRLRTFLLYQQIRIANPEIEGRATAKAGLLIAVGFIELFLIWNHGVVVPTLEFPFLL
jgi:hypothetical protein